jgi:Ser/Thr protein kinase RdoA (MazF antagonist)
MPVLDMVSLLPLARQFSSTAEKIEFIRESHNITYRVFDAHTSFILRVTSIKHRTWRQLESELDFQMYLYQNQAPVVKPLTTQDDKYIIEYFSEGETYYITAFTMAEGENWNNRSDNSKDRWTAIGEALGAIHNLSRKYRAKPSIQKRRFWNESQHLVNAPIVFSRYDSDLSAVFLKDMARYRTLPTDCMSFGLTHGDFLLSNYMIDRKNKVTVFDFDECEYSWFAVDIAICMHCYLIGAKPMELTNKSEMAESMLYHLLLGYKITNTIGEMISELQSFFRIRDYIYLSTILEKEGELSGWEKQFVETAMNRLINSDVFLDFNFKNSVQCN